jgi:hypothetical protein
MAAYKQLSEYFSEDGKRRSSVLKNLDSLKYHVTTISDSGTAFTCVFDIEEDAEQFAEDWVML